MEMLDIPFCFDSVVQLICVIVFFTPMVHMDRFLSRSASTYKSHRYQAEGRSPIQSGVQTLPFLLSVVVCEYGFIIYRQNQ